MKPIFAVFSAICTCLMLCLQSACDSQIETINPDYGFSYFPMDSGHWVIYQVDSVIYSKFLSNGKDTVSTQLKEVIAGTFIDNEGKEARKIERYVRQNSSQAWSEINPTIWYALRDSQRAERMEGDLRFIKNVFPITDGKSWNGNVYINTANNDLKLYNDWNYTYSNINQATSITAYDFDNNAINNTFAKTLTISQKTHEENNDNKAEHGFGIEQYADGVGMIYKELWLLDIGGKPIESTDTWPNRAEKGFITWYRILDYKH